MVGQYKGLAIALLSQNEGGRAVIMPTAIGARCVTAEMAPNILSRGTPVPQLRFICDGYCGLVAKRPSKQCRAVDRRNVAVQIPAGVTVTNGSVGTPYRSGGSGSTLQLPGQQPFSPFPLQ